MPASRAGTTTDATPTPPPKPAQPVPKRGARNRYAAKIRGILSCSDRIVLTGNLPEIGHPEAMTKHLGGKDIRVFDYATWAKPLSDEIRAQAEKVAQENGLTIDYIARPRSFRKEERIKAIVEKRGSHPGFVHIFSVIESCTEFQGRHCSSRGSRSAPDRGPGPG